LSRRFETNLLTEVQHMLMIEEKQRQCPCSALIPDCASVGGKFLSCSLPKSCRATKPPNTQAPEVQRIRCNLAILSSPRPSAANLKIHERYLLWLVVAAEPLSSAHRTPSRKLVTHVHNVIELALGWFTRTSSLTAVRFYDCALVSAENNSPRLVGINPKFG